MKRVFYALLILLAAATLTTAMDKSVLREAKTVEVKFDSQRAVMAKVPKFQVPEEVRVVVHENGSSRTWVYVLDRERTNNADTTQTP